MSDSSVRRLALILAVQAEIEGMKAFNQAQFNTNGIVTQYYKQSDFDQKADELKNLAYTHDIQLGI